MRPFIFSALLLLGTMTRAADNSATTNAPSSRPLTQVLEYISRVAELSIVVRDEELKKLSINPDDITSLKNATWRAMLEVVCRKHKLRIDEALIKEKLIVVYRPERITMNFKNADIREVLWAIAQSGKLNVVIDPDVKGNVTATLNDVACDEALGIIARTLGFEVVVEKTGGIKVR